MMQYIPRGAWDLDATPLRNGQFAVRPKGRLGTCGWIGGLSWTVLYVKAHSHEAARNKAFLQLVHGRRTKHT